MVDAKKELKENTIILKSTKRRFEEYNDKRVKTRSNIYDLTSKLKSVDNTVIDTESLIQLQNELATKI